MRITFFLPEHYRPSDTEQKAWESGAIHRLEGSGKIASAQCWIFQTWVHLVAAGVRCELSSAIPDNGILIALAGFFSDCWQPPRNVFFANIVADYVPHPSAHLHIVQNMAHAARLPRSVYMPHWPQPNLLPRSRLRGNVFEKVAFFGDPDNLAAELRSRDWQDELKKSGLHLDVRRADRWHDYSDVDCVLAVRDFSRSTQIHKPATKLYNAWLAGVPFIGGRDSAYATDGRSGQDFLRADSPAATLQHLQRLRDDPDLRNRLVINGLTAGKKFSREATGKRWAELVGTTIPARATRWLSSPPLRRFFFCVTQQAMARLDRRLR